MWWFRANLDSSGCQPAARPRGRPAIGPASEARLRARRSGPSQPEISRAVGLRPAAMWGRLSTCGRVVLGPASGARLRARRSGPRQAGLSRAVGLRLCCSAGQVVNLRPRPEGTRNRPGERSSPARETIRPPAARNIPRGWVAALLLWAGCQPAAPPGGHPQSAPRAKLACLPPFSAPSPPDRTAACPHPARGNPRGRGSPRSSRSDRRPRRRTG